MKPVVGRFGGKLKFACPQLSDSMMDSGMDLRKKVRYVMMTLNGLKAIGKIMAQIEFLA